MKAAGKKDLVGNGLVSVLGALGDSRERAANASQGFCYFLGTVAKTKNKRISKGFNSLFSIIGQNGEQVCTSIIGSTYLNRGPECNTLNLLAYMFFPIAKTGQKDISLGLFSFIGMFKSPRRCVLLASFPDPSKHVCHSRQRLVRYHV